MSITFEFGELMRYVNWAYLYHAWRVVGNDTLCNKLRSEAEVLACELEGKYKVRACVELLDAWSEGDDIVVRQSPRKEVRLPMLRQQQGENEAYLCLADFVSPVFNIGSDFSRVGVFACAIDERVEHLYDYDVYRRMLVQTLSDRLAEAAAERLHEQVRRHIWGYARGEHFGVNELFACKYQGIRPAVGYPCLPDMSINFIIDKLIDMRSIGIRLTESGAMLPHAAVSGLMFAHPRARYFDVGDISDEQLHDYARRRQLPNELVAKFITKK